MRVQVVERLFGSIDSAKERWLRLYITELETELLSQVTVEIGEPDDLPGSAWYIHLPVDCVHVLAYAMDMALVMACGLNTWTERVDCVTENTFCVYEYPEIICADCKAALMQVIGGDDAFDD